MTPRKAQTGVLAYLRCSIEEQRKSGLGIGSQEEKIRAFCLATDRKLTSVVKDEAYSGKDLKRPGIQRVLDAVRNRSIKTVIVYKLDRLTRNLGDLCSMMAEFEKHGVDLVSVSEAFDSSLAVGKLMAHLLGSFAEWERSMISTRTSDAIKYAQSQGRRFGRVGYGYVREGDKLKPVPGQQRALREMKELRTAGVSFNRIAEAMNRQGVKPNRGKEWYASSIKAVLESQMQAGV